VRLILADRWSKGRPSLVVAARLAGLLLRCKMGIGQFLAWTAHVCITIENQVACQNLEGSVDSPRIDLAHEPGFMIGNLNVHPSTRELSRDGERQVIEPRVMQVLVALYRAGGAVVSKDDLAQSCWEGRVVGEDAINRVLSRLRKVSDGIGKDDFRVETVSRVGYRLMADGVTDPPTMAVANYDVIAAPRSISRRLMLAATGAAVAGASGGWYFYNRRPVIPSELATLIENAESALKYNTPEQIDAAIAIMQEAARLYPIRAEAWGKLAIAYRHKAVNRRRADAANLLSLMQAAARRAIEIDPGNADGAVIIAVGNGLWYSSYLDFDRETRLAFARFPDHEMARRSRSGFLFETGQIRESIKIGAPLVDALLPSPTATSHAIKLWSAGRPDEAEALLDTLIARWPRHYSVWGSRYKFLLFSGKVKKAELMLDEIPVGLDDIDFEILRAQTAAIGSVEPADIELALRLFDGVASKVMSKAQEAASFASSVNRVDAAFNYLDLLFVSGEPIRAFRKNLPAAQLRPHSGVMTFLLFEPPMKAARADPRFDALTAKLGLKEYWLKANVKPDFIV
jgi:DNA-binding winged helix-turn-helix (wHTH) protein/tetratricopeptide (TPR) repeat protein